MPITDISTVLHFIGGQNILQEVANIQATLTDNIYDKDTIDDLLEAKAETDSVYDKDTIDSLLYDKIDKTISSLAIGNLTINSSGISKTVTVDTTTTTSNVLFDDDLSFTKQSGSDEIATISYKNTTYSILKEKYINSASVVNVIKNENNYYENTVSEDNKIEDGLVPNAGRYIKLTFNTDNSDIIYINVDSIGAEYNPSSNETDVNISIDQATHTIGASLTETGVTSGGYGSVAGNSISMPTFNVDSTGRITSAENTNFNLPTLSSLGAVSTITATGTAPLTLQAESTDTSYTITGNIADASNNAKGVVKVGDNISINGGTISLSKDNVTSALGYTPYDQNDLAGALENYKKKQTAVSTPSAYGNDIAFIDSISQDEQGKIAISKKNVNFPDYSDIYQPKANYKTTQDAVTDPTAVGDSTTFIDSIVQDENGVITVTKKNIDLSSKMDKTNPTGVGYLSLNAAATPGNYSVAAGCSTTASGTAAVALGNTSTAKAANSFASGLGTIAAAPNQAVFGQYNKEDADALFVVGNGSGGEAAKRANLMWLTSQGYLHATKVYGAVWNDYAEYRQTHYKVRPGQCVYEKGDGSLAISYERMMPGANIVSDTFGFAIGETDECKTPLAVSGRVLAYPYESKETYNPGDAVCSGPNGTISKMTRAEIRDYPERIVGTVSEIPTYEVWGSGNIKVNGRIWIKVR